MCEKSNPNNTDLYNFRFSDRDNERLILRNFLSDNKDKILWIKGVSGAGKSFFVKNCRCLLSNYKVVEFEYYDEIVLTLAFHPQNITLLHVFLYMYLIY